ESAARRVGRRAVPRTLVGAAVDPLPAHRWPAQLARGDAGRRRRSRTRTRTRRADLTPQLARISAETTRSPTVPKNVERAGNTRSLRGRGDRTRTCDPRFWRSMLLRRFAGTSCVVGRSLGRSHTSPAHGPSIGTHRGIADLLFRAT